jgi:hypothetical protein
MSPYRLTAGPLMGFTPAFLQSFAFNLQNPDRGPCVPVPAESANGDDWSFEGRPLRNAPSLFAQIAADMAARLPPADQDRPLSGCGPSKGGLDWYLTGVRSDPERDRFGFTFHRKGKDGKARIGQFYEVASDRGRTFVGINTIACPHFCLSQESQWSREAAANTDLLRTTVFSKKGPPDWEGMRAPFAEVLPLLSLALYQARGDEPLSVRSDRYRGWTNASSAFDGPQDVADWLAPAFRNREFASVRTLRKIDFFDRYGRMPHQESVLEARWFKPYKKSEWYLEISYRQVSGESTVPSAVTALAQAAIGEPATEEGV